MKNRVMKSAVIAGVAFACGLLNSHATVIDFTSAQGYTTGTLGSNGDWNEGSGLYVVDATAGTASVQATGGEKWVKAAYVGPGGTLTNNNYLMETTFRMTVAANASLVAVGGDAILNRSGYEGGQTAFVSMRQRSGGNGLFDLWMLSNITTNNPSSGSGNFTAADIGLAHNDVDAWTDTVSDLLKTVHKLEYNSGTGTWTQTAELWNLTTTTQLASMSADFADDSATPFLDADNSIRIDSGRLDRVPDLTYTYESISIEQIPEPATLGLIAMAGGGLLFVRRFLGM